MADSDKQDTGKAGGRSAGEDCLRKTAELLLTVFPLQERVDAIKEIAQIAPADANGASARLAAVRYAMELNGIVTVADDKRAQNAAEALPTIVIESGIPPSKAASRIKALATTGKAK
jgi:hypothetical protein